MKKLATICLTFLLCFSLMLPAIALAAPSTASPVLADEASGPVTIHEALPERNDTDSGDNVSDRGVSSVGENFLSGEVVSRPESNNQNPYASLEKDKEPTIEKSEDSASKNTGQLSSLDLGARDTSLSGLYTITSAAESSKVLDVQSGSMDSGANIWLYEKNTSPAQRFRFTMTSDGYYIIKNVASGKVLNVEWGNAHDRANVWQYASDGTDAEKWKAIPTGDADGSYYLASKLNERYCLDLAGGSTGGGTNVQIYTANKTIAQKFLLKKITQTVADGIYAIGNAASDKVLDIANGSTDNLANAQLYSKNLSLAQKFQVSYDRDSGYYSIMNGGSGKVLDVADAGDLNGTNVQQANANGSNAQKWTIIDGGQGAYVFYAACSGLALDACGGGVSDGTNVQTYSFNNTNAQKWRFSEVHLLDSGLFNIKNDLGTVLDAAAGGTENTTKMQTYSSNGSLAQKYQTTYVEGGYYKIECSNSGRVLDVANGVGPQVQLFDFNGTDAQLWKPLIAGERAFLLQNKKTGQVLDVCNGSSAPGTSVQIHAANWSSAQRWSFGQTSAFTEGLYTISTALDATKVLDIKNGSVENGALLNIFETNGTAAQKFKIIEAGGGYYQIVGLGSNKSLDIRDWAIDPNTGEGFVQQYTSLANDAQLWRFEYAGNGYYSIYTKLQGGISCLDVQWGSSANGTAVWLFAPNGNPSQKFHFSLIGSTSSALYSMTLKQMTDWQMTNPYVVKAGTTWSEAYNLLNPSGGNSMYQFADLRLPSRLSAEHLDSYISSNRQGNTGKLAGMGYAFVRASELYGVNECYLLSHAILESGWGTSTLAKGYSYDGKTPINGTYYPAGTYYNFYGIGAFDDSPLSGGRSLAIQNGWNTPETAIIGAAKWITSNYTYRTSFAQPTLYDMKWDVRRSSVIGERSWHQYASDVYWANSIATLMGDCFSWNGITPSMRYIIPVYKS